MFTHNHDDNHSSPMMWLMMLCCLFPLLVLVPSVGKWLSGGYFWVILIGGFVMLHFWMRRKQVAGKKDQNNFPDKINLDESDSTHDKRCH